MRALRLLLVHGTWGRKSGWVAETSLLHSGLARRFALTGSAAVRWSGGNTFYARRKAQAALTQELEATAKVEAGAIICAHSHGGAVVAYTLRDRPDLQQHVHGAVFLATPFLSLRLLPSWRLLLNGLLAPIPLMALFVFANLLTQITIFALAQFFPSASGSAYETQAVATICCVTFVTLMVALAFLIIFNRFETKLARRLLRRSIYLSYYLSAHLPTGTRALFIRTSGDEAAAFLTFFQGLSWMLLFLNVAFSYVFWFATRPFRIKKLRRPLLVLGIVVSIALLHSLAMVDFFGRWQPFQLNMSTVDFGRRLAEHYTLAWNVQYYAGGYLHLAGLAYLAGLLAVFFLAVSVLAVMFVWSAATFVSNWLVSVFFGRMPFFSGGVLQVAVEMVPPGSWEVIHSSWSRQKERGFLWRHSDPYNDEKMIRQIGDWLDGASTRSASRR